MRPTPPERRTASPLLLLVFAAVVIVAIFVLKNLGSGPAPTADSVAGAARPDAVADEARAPAAEAAPAPRPEAPRPAEPAPTAPTAAGPSPADDSPRPIPGGAGLPAISGMEAPTALADVPAAAASDETEPNEGAERLVYAPNREGIQTAVGGETEHLRECYEAWLAADPALGGKVKVQLVISAPDSDDDEALARISGVKIMGTSLAGESAQFIEGCVMNVMSSLRFDPPTGGPLTVNYPFIFRSETD